MQGQHLPKKVRNILSSTAAGEGQRRGIMGQDESGNGVGVGRLGQKGDGSVAPVHDISCPLFLDLFH